MTNLNQTRHDANSVVVFRDRLDVGRLLAERLAPYHGPGVLVVGIARGGVPVAGELARRLEAELDVVVVRKLGAPGFRHVGIGAVTADGTRILNHDVIRALNVSETYVEAVTSVQKQEATWIERRVRDLRPAADVTNRVVILVDDGASTGATVRVAAQSLRRHRPARLIAALPVVSPTARAAFHTDFDQLVCLHQPDVFDAIADYYQYFEPVDDVQVRWILEASRTTAEAAVV
jgi:predicted phosphoribosyltransferase